jgi:hypothetical protein
MAIYSPVVRAQENLARTLGQGLSSLGDRPLEEKRMGLAETQMMHELNRQRLADEREGRRLEIEEKTAAHLYPHQIAQDKQQAEAAELSAQAARQMYDIRKTQAMRDDYLWNLRKSGIKADALLDERRLADIEKQNALGNMPITARALAQFYFGTDPEPEAVANFLKEGTLKDALKIMGATMNQDEQGTLTFTKKNGEVARWSADSDRIVEVLDDLTKSNIDPGHLRDQMIRKYEEMDKLIKESDEAGRPLPPQIVQAHLENKKNYLQMKADKKDPQVLINEYEKLNEIDYGRVAKYESMGLDTGRFLRNIARRKEKIAKHEGRQVAAASAELKIKLETIKAGKPTDYEKKAKYISKLTGRPEAEVAKLLRLDKSLGVRIESFSEEAKLLQKQFDSFGGDEELFEAKLEKLQRKYGISAGQISLDFEKAKEEESKPKETNDPDNLRILMQ